MILKYRKKKRFLSYCPKLFGTGLEPTTLSTTYKFSRFYFGYTQRIERKLFFVIFM